MIHENVLVVDFNVETNRVIKDVLSKQGYNVITTNSAQSFFNDIQKKIIDVLIINLTLEGLDSIELIQRARFIRPDISIIVISLNQTGDMIVKAFEEGVQAVIRPQFDSRDLIKIVNEVLSKSRLIKENLRLKSLLSLFKLTEPLSLEQSEEHILDYIVRQVYMEVRADKVSLMLLDDSTQHLIIKAGLGLPKDAIGECIEVSDDKVSYSVIKTGTAVISDGKSGSPKSKSRSGRMTIVCVPLSSKSKTIGVINCSKFATKTGFTESDLDLLTILAGWATASIENAHLFENIRQQQNKLESLSKKTVTAHEGEWKRISLELNDKLEQLLVSALHRMHMVESQISMLKYENARTELGRATEIINQSIKELKKIILDFHSIA